MSIKKLAALISAAAVFASSMGALSLSAYATETVDPPSTETTPAPPDPLTPLDVTALPKDTLVTFETGTGTSYTTPAVFGGYVAVYAGEYAGETQNIDIDGSNKTFEDTKGKRSYTSRLKFGGAAVLDANGAPAIRTISVTPDAAGTLVVDFANASGSDETARTFAAYQNGDIVGTASVNKGEQNILAVEVEAGEPVYLYSQRSGINIYGIFLTDDYQLPQAPEAVETTPIPLGTNVDFASSGLTDKQQITENTVLADGRVAVYANASAYMEARNSNRTVDGIKYSIAVRTIGGVVKTEGVPSARAISIIPAEAGLLTVPFGHPSDETAEPRTLEAMQNGEVIGTASVAGGTETIMQVKVAANEPVYIYSPDNVNIYGVKLAEIIESEPLPAGTRVTFESGYDADTETGTTFSSTQVFERYAVVYASESKTVTIGGSNKTFGDYKYTAAARLNEPELSGLVPTTRAISVIPAAAGTLSVDCSNASGTDARSIKIVQNETELKSEELAASGEATVTAEVAAGAPVYIYTTGGINVYGVLLTSQGGVTPPADDDIMKITASYDDNGVLQNVQIDTVKKSEAGDPVLDGKQKVFYWESLEGMVPYTGEGGGEEQPPVTETELTPVTEARTWTFTTDEYAQYGDSTTDGEGQLLP